MATNSCVDQQRFLYRQAFTTCSSSQVHGSQEQFSVTLTLSWWLPTLPCNEEVRFWVHWTILLWQRPRSLHQLVPLSCCLPCLERTQGSAVIQLHELCAHTWHATSARPCVLRVYLMPTLPPWAGQSHFIELIWTQTAGLGCKQPMPQPAC